MPQKLPRLPHPAVDWTTIDGTVGGRLVSVTCPWCKQPRRDNAALVAARIRKGTYTGYCYRDRLIGRARTDRLERPAHPAVDWDATRLVTVNRQRLTRVRVTCPRCDTARWGHPGQIAAKLRSGGFTGQCLGCSKNARRHEWVTLGPGRKVDPVRGYIRLTAAAIAAEERWLFDAMRGTTTYLLEHRLVMARALGRPLRSNELVDHQDGVKTNNEPGNLRLYIRGKNMPGETSGYGTYYHEWQTALARVRKLEALLPSP